MMVACGCGQVFVAVRWYSWSKRVAVKFTTFDAQLYYVVCVDWAISEAVDVGVEDLKICVACWSPIGGVVVEPTAGTALTEEVGGCWSAHRLDSTALIRSVMVLNSLCTRSKSMSDIAFEPLGFTSSSNLSIHDLLSSVRR